MDWKEERQRGKRLIQVQVGSEIQEQHEVGQMDMIILVVIEVYM